MGKTKKQKRKEQDFRKPKLKVGKKRPESDNVTKTAFKAASIQLALQLQEKKEPTNKRKLTLQDLIGQLNHYNNTIRMSALDGLKELFTDHSHILLANLGKVISKVTDKIMDPDSGVRTSLHSCMSYIFENTKDLEIKPFVEIIVAHLNCALTHINEDIQVDAMAILDKCGKFYPNLFAQYSKQFLLTIIGMVTKNFRPNETEKDVSKRNQNVKGNTMIPGNIVFNIEPRKRLSSLKMKCVMLQRIASLIASLWTTSEKSSNITPKVSIVSKSQNNDFTYFQQNITGLRALESLSSFMLFDKPDSNHDEKKHLFEQILSLVPVLFDTWIECCPYQFASGFIDKNIDQSILRSLKLVTCIINHIAILWSNVKHTDDQYITSPAFLGTFKEHFMKYFPFVVPDNSYFKFNKKLKVTREDITSTLLETNTNIAEIICTLTSNLPENRLDIGQWEDKLVKYFCNSLENFGVLHSYHKVVIKVAVVLVTKEDENVSTIIFKNMQLLYEKAYIGSRHRLTLICFLKTLLKDKRTLHLLQNERFHSWSRLLAKDIAKTLAHGHLSHYEELLEFFLEVSRYNFECKPYLEQIRNSLLEIFSRQLQKFGSLPDNLQRRTIELVYFIDSLSCEILKSFALLCHSTNVRISIKNYLISVLLYCLPCRMNCKNAAVNVGLFTSFIFSVLVGYTKDQLEALQGCKVNPISNITPFILKEDTLITMGFEKEDKTDRVSRLSLHKALVKTSVDGLMLQPFANNLSILLYDSMKMVSNDYAFLPEKTVLGLLLLVQSMVSTTGVLLPTEDQSLAKIFAPVISNSIILYESRHMLDSTGIIWTETESPFLSDISAAGVHLLDTNITFFKELIIHWSDIIKGADDDDLFVGIAESLVFLIKKCQTKDWLLLGPTESLLTILCNSDALGKKTDLLAQLKYTSSLPKL